MGFIKKEQSKPVVEDVGKQTDSKTTTGTSTNQVTVIEHMQKTVITIYPDGRKYIKTSAWFNEMKTVNKVSAAKKRAIKKKILPLKEKKDLKQREL